MYCIIDRISFLLLLLSLSVFSLHMDASPDYVSVDMLRTYTLRAHYFVESGNNPIMDREGTFRVCIIFVGLSTYQLKLLG